MVLLQRKLYFSNDLEELQLFPGGPIIPGGIQMLISIETHLTCDFLGGLGPPIPPPLDPHIGTQSQHIQFVRHSVSH